MTLSLKNILIPFIPIRYETKVMKNTQPELLKRYCEILDLPYPMMSSHESVIMLMYCLEYNKELLRSKIQELAKNGESLSPIFSLFLADVLTGRIERPPGKKATNFSQDSEIFKEVIKLIIEGYPTSDNQKDLSVFTIVAEKFNVKHSHVRDLYYKLRGAYISMGGKDGERLFNENFLLK